MPIGSRAVYQPATLRRPAEIGPTTDEDLIVMQPGAPRVDVLVHDADWDRSRTRCGSIVKPQKVLFHGLPIPRDFSTGPESLGNTPNNGAAILAADGRTVKQTQPFHRCGSGGPAVSQYVFDDVDIVTGDGITGAHGGSGMSALGGTIRVGEMRPGGRLRHALKMNLWGRYDLFCARSEPDGRSGYRWPAVAADGGACEAGDGNFYGGRNREVQMGSLLALRPSFDVARLKTEPGRIIARALQDYGAYVVDNTAWDVIAFETEYGPDGRVTDEVKRHFGVEFGTVRADPPNRPTADFTADVDRMLAAMTVVVNNGPRSVGGGGTPRRPLAPPFATG